MGSYCRVVVDKGTERDTWEEGAVTPASHTEGALHGEACRMFFFLFFFYCFEQKGGGLLVRHGLCC